MFKMELRGLLSILQDKIENQLRLPTFRYINNIIGTQGTVSFTKNILGYLLQRGSKVRRQRKQQ